MTSLLRSGAKRDQLTSKGRTALQVAETCNVQESHLEVQGLTQGDLSDGKSKMKVGRILLLPSFKPSDGSSTPSCRGD